MRLFQISGTSATLTTPRKAVVALDMTITVNLTPAHWRRRLATHDRSFSSGAAAATMAGGRLRRLAALPLHQTADLPLTARVHHPRTHGGEREIDLMVERGDGKILAVDVKLVDTANDHDVLHRRWLAECIEPPSLLSPTLLGTSASFVSGRTARR